ncbi:MAG: signal peptidase I [Solirubrobacteraceae bacterium]
MSGSPSTALVPRALSPRPVSRRPRVRRSLRIADRASGLLCGLALVLLAALLLATALGYRPLVDHSDSMRPAIRAGDLLITHREPARRVRVGQIVSFDDPALAGRLVTHRVVGVRAAGGRIEVLTRGDANPTPESWSVARSGAVGTLVLRIPGVGRAVAWMADPRARTILLTLSALVLSAALLRRIWRA